MKERYTYRLIQDCIAESLLVRNKVIYFCINTYCLYTLCYVRMKMKKGMYTKELIQDSVLCGEIWSETMLFYVPRWDREMKMHKRSESNVFISPYPFYVIYWQRKTLQKGKRECSSLLQDIERWKCLEMEGEKGFILFIHFMWHVWNLRKKWKGGEERPQFIPWNCYKWEKRKFTLLIKEIKWYVEKSNG